MEADLRIRGATWHDMLARGVIALAFGMLVLLWPGLTITDFVMLFSTFAIVDGVLLVLQAATYRRESRWWARMMQGVISFSAGITAIVWPGITLPALAWIIITYAVLTGIIQVFSAYLFRSASRGQMLLLISGMLSTGLGVFMAFVPFTDLSAMARIVGIFTIAGGAMVSAHGLMLRYLARRPAPGRT